MAPLLRPDFLAYQNKVLSPQESLLRLPLRYFKILKAPLSSGKRAVDMVILSHQVFIKCKYPFVCDMWFSVHPMWAFWVCVYLHCALHTCLCVFSLRHMQPLFYWASQNSPGPQCDCVFMCDGHFWNGGVGGGGLAWQLELSRSQTSSSVCG